MEIVRFDKPSAQKVDFPIDAWIIAKLGKCELVQLHLGMGEKLDSHPNPVDVTFYVLSGEGILQVEDEKRELTAMDCVSVSKDLIRSWENTGEDILQLLVVKILA